jgi:RHS repeat-associated protein
MTDNRNKAGAVALDMPNDGAVIHPAVWEQAKPTATRPLLLQTPSGWFTCGFDQVKNVTEQLFDSAGNIAATYDYSPLGEDMAATGPAAVLNPFRFFSEAWDVTLGLVQYNYRPYNPLDGRFLNRDPIGERGGLNLYQFCGNDPVNRVDADGEAPQLIGVNDKGKGIYSSDRDWGDYDPQWGGRRNPYGNKRGIYSWGCHAKQEGEKYGWPYAHVLANAGITRDHGAATAWMASLMKEVSDTIKGLSGNDECLYSAWQPLDFEMNQIGRSIPPYKTPEQWAEPYKNTPEGDPGPFYKWLY